MASDWITVRESPWTRQMTGTNCPSPSGILIYLERSSFTCPLRSCCLPPGCTPTHTFAQYLQMTAMSAGLVWCASFLKLKKRRRWRNIAASDGFNISKLRGCCTSDVRFARNVVTKVSDGLHRRFILCEIFFYS